MTLLAILFVALIVGIIVWIEAEAHGAHRAWREKYLPERESYRPGDFIE